MKAPLDRGDFEKKINDLYAHSCDHCHDLADTENGFEISDEVINKALKNIYNEKFNPKKDIEPALFEATWQAYNHATVKGITASKVTSLSDRFVAELKYNNAVFAAFKTHRQQNDIAKVLTDEEGKLKPFAQFSKDAAPITSEYNQTWLKTEYNTALHRAQLAADWQQFEAEKDILPNLEWMPTTSANPGADHIPFWGTVEPIDSDFWNTNRPGDRWNCKCSLEATDKETVPAPETAIKNGEDKADPGLDNNPGVDAKIFGDSHPYVADAYKGAKSAVDDYLNEEDINPPKRESKKKKK